MSYDKLKTRDQIDDKYKWNIGAMIEDEDAIDSLLESIKTNAAKFSEKYTGNLTCDGATLAQAYIDKDQIWRELEKIYVYAHMKRDENNANEKYQAMADKAMSVIASVSASLSFFTPELLSASENTILGFIEETPELKTYQFTIKDTLRQKAHVLSPAEENILAQMSEITRASDDIFTMLNNADIKFGTITDEDGNLVELTHGNYIKFMQSHNARLRQDAYNSMYDAYKKLINTIATTYNYNVKSDVINARLRHYDSARSAALDGDNIPASVYDNLVATVNDNLPAMHRYMELRKKLMNLDNLTMSDIYVPLIEIPDQKFSFEEGLDIMRQALKPLGQEYINGMNEGISEGWIDVYENEGKTSGAYSYGCYDSYPYILLNYTDTLNDVFTIIHEMGHSMHAKYTRANQPYIYGGHSIFTAEVASTVNESLLMAYLFETNDDIQMKKYLLNMHLEAFRTTLFRQTMFAEFEDITHKAIESGQVLTAEWMCDQYEDLNRKYYGPAVATDDTIRYEWARIPHFYSAFYVYKYATGYSAATAICEKILTQGSDAALNYIEFLKTGQSDCPIELLKIAGVDMSSPEPIKKAMDKFNSLLDELEKLI